jgi:glutathione-regulated potassium-efflux system ancillary protein KefG
MVPTVNTEDLIGAAEVAKLLGLAHHNSVTTYLRRYDDFPRPVVDLSESRIRLWLRQDIVEWRDRRSRHPSR